VNWGSSCLSNDALLLFDEWLEWLLKGFFLETETMVGELREDLIENIINMRLINA